MDALANIALGFSVAFTPANLAYCLLGCLVGTLIGVLPGIGPVATIAILLPQTFSLAPESALIMLAGIYYGAQYGGSTTAILANMPGETSSVVTCLDGHKMARKGEAGLALAVVALGSFFAGTVANLVVALAGPPLSALAYSFGQAEYFALMTLGLVAAVVLASGDLVKAIGMAMIGVVLGLVGTDVNTGAQRFTFGLFELADGIGFLVIAMGVFGLGEIVANLEQGADREVFAKAPRGLLPPWRKLKRAVPSVLRGTVLGSLLGILPGGGAVLASFASYMLEKRIAKGPERFGHGAIEGVAAPESANNAAAQTSFIPLLTLGIPPNAVMALMVGALTIHNIQPGPGVMAANPALFWGMIASMWIGNLMLLILNLPLVGLWVRLIAIPYRLIFPAILVFCAIGVYSVSLSTTDIVLTAAFGLIGYFGRKLECEGAPLLLGFVLGPMMEESLRRAMVLSGGDATVLVTRPISAILLLLALGLLAATILPTVNTKRRGIFAE
ncbi:MAG: tripartite tricarboxylate transporter permease [Hyphomicrobiaceae bacterium]|nr:MAG: tripartite tricarboxylate transporter permease [Hyphomicrobiaceae bacterium]